MSTEDALAARDFTREMGKLWASLKMVVFQIGAALLPGARELRRQIMPIVKQVIDWTKENRGLIVSAAKVGLVIAGIGVAVTALGYAFGVLGVIVTAAKVAWVALTLVMAAANVVMAATEALVLAIGAPEWLAVAAGIAVVVAAGAGLVALFVYLKSEGDVVGWLGEQFQNTANDAIEAWDGLADAIKAGDVTLAIRIAWAFIKLEFARGKAWVLDTWDDMILGMATGLYTMALGVKTIWTSILAYLKAGLIGLKVFTHQLSAEAGEAALKQLAADTRARKAGDAEDARKHIEAATKIIDAQKKGRQDDIEAAQKELHDLRGEAAEKVARAKEAPAGIEPAPVEPLKVLQKADVAGTFNATIAGQMGFGHGLAERTANATEETAENTRDMAAALAGGGGERLNF
jgi:hypothetical protein